MTDPVILQVAVATPLRRLFDYLPPLTDVASVPAWRPGQRVRVPFGAREVVGMVAGTRPASGDEAATLKRATALLDAEPLFDDRLWQLLVWAADYYHHALGEVTAQALPTLLRQGRDAAPAANGWRLTTRGHGLPAGALQRSPRQAVALTALQAGAVADDQLAALDLRREHLRALQEKGLAERCVCAGAPAVTPRSAPLPLNPDQASAVAAVAADRDRFACHLLEGVTGSGKTEVYLQLIDQVIASGRQVLVLVPEIGLTPQTLARFAARVDGAIALLHSGLSDGERLTGWQQARDGRAALVLGTRSAVFTPCPRLGLVIVDEEHDPSYKQQDGFRYHARDVAIKRAAALGIPVLLGSATPNLETLGNALGGRYRHHLLNERAGGARPPRLELLDIRHAPLQDGLSEPALAALAGALRDGNQALVFLNRRGFAPALLCHDCGWLAGCRHCDARLTVHVGDHQLRCHHCSWQRPLPRCCDDCNGSRLEYRGPGTERLEQALRHHFPDTDVLRIDRDTTSRRDALQDMLATVAEGRPCLLVGTQMLAKGHHFPGVTLVVMVDVDGGLFSADFRGPERMGQLITQVAGRAGRGDRPGRVLLQTHYPDHPLLTRLVGEGYGPYARELLAERRQLGLPPYAHLALVRADGPDLDAAEALLASIKPATPGVTALGPLPAPMSRRAGLFRAQLLLQAGERAALHGALHALATALAGQPQARRIRCSIDVDPVDMS